MSSEIITSNDLRAILNEVMPYSGMCYMEIALSANTTMSFSATWNWQKVPCDTLRFSYGTGLKFESNGIKVEEEGYYAISGILSANAPYYSGLRLNGGNISQALSPNTSYTGFGLGSYVRYCAVDDFIDLGMCKTTSTNPTVAGMPSTILTVQRVG